MSALGDKAKAVLKTVLTDLVAGKSVGLTFTEAEQTIAQELKDEFTAILRYHGITPDPASSTATTTTTVTDTATTSTTTGS